MKVEIYSKRECSLCDDAKATLAKVRQRIPFDLVETDIESRPELYQRYLYDIPVVFIDGRKAFKHRFSEADLLKRLLSGT